jgi:hypothetical protein
VNSGLFLVHFSEIRTAKYSYSEINLKYEFFCIFKESFCYGSSSFEHALVRRTTVWDKSNISLHWLGKENAFSVFGRSEFLCVEGSGHSERIKSETLTIRHCIGRAIDWAVSRRSVTAENWTRVPRQPTCFFRGEKKWVFSETASFLTCHLLRRHSFVLIPLSCGCWALQRSRFYTDIFSSHHENCKINFVMETNLICPPRYSCIPLSHYVRRVD